MDAQREADTLCAQLQSLAREMENLRNQLHEAQNDEARAAGEATTAREELQNAQATVTQLHCRCQSAEERCEQLEAEWERAKLNQYWKLEVERRKWEKREERLAKQLEAAHQSTRASVDACREDSSLIRATILETTSPPLTHEPRRESSGTGLTDAGSPRPAAVSLFPATVQPTHMEDVSSPLPTASPLWSAALLAHQFPPMQQFTGEDAAESGETCQDWIEQLEMIASIRHWDERTKLVNLTIRLTGQAYAFYKSYPEQQRKSYSSLKDELTKPFTPVRLCVVQSGLFHDRKQ